MTNMNLLHKKICIFCSSNSNLDNAITTASKNLLSKIASIVPQPTIIYGGTCCGLMKIIADTYKNHGGRIIGIIPEFMVSKALIYPYLDDVIITNSLNDRKSKMIELADLFIMLPGGIGTYDEFFNTLAYKQLHLHNKPIIVYNINNFYKPLEDLLNHGILHNTISKDHIALISIKCNDDEIVELIKSL